ncbi:aminoglycoside phosphotransferase family protein [Kitasatospora viridis]|nr:aminoglycoside phosphotransferase family protein [Kitasatospora viridis]
MHPDEHPIDAALVRRLLAEQFPQWAGPEPVRVRSTGTDNAMFRLGERLAVRLPRVADAVGSITREQEWLPRLGPLLPRSVPLPVATGRPGAGFPWPWTVCEWAEGDNPVVGGLAEPDGLATDLGEFVAALHAVRLPGGPPAGRGRPLARRDAGTRAALDEAVRLGEPLDREALLTIWQAALDAPGWTGPPVWLHGDLAPGNLLLDADQRLTAVIDFGAMGTGDPAVDLYPAWNLLPAASRPAFRAAAGEDDATWVRARGWALSIALIQLPYYRDRNPALAASSRHVIGQLLKED